MKKHGGPISLRLYRSCTVFSMIENGKSNGDGRGKQRRTRSVTVATLSHHHRERCRKHGDRTLFIAMMADNPFLIIAAQSSLPTFYRSLS
jgi:hypothetical protein